MAQWYGRSNRKPNDARRVGRSKVEGPETYPRLVASSILASGVCASGDGQTMVWDQTEDEPVAMMGRKGTLRTREARAGFAAAAGDHSGGPSSGTEAIRLCDCEHNNDKDVRETIAFRESLKGPGHWDETLLDPPDESGPDD